MELTKEQKLIVLKQVLIKVDKDFKDHEALNWHICLCYNISYYMNVILNEHKYIAGEHKIKQYIPEFGIDADTKFGANFMHNYWWTRYDYRRIAYLEYLIDKIENHKEPTKFNRIFDNDFSKVIIITAILLAFYIILKLFVL